MSKAQDKAIARAAAANATMDATGIDDTTVDPLEPPPFIAAAPVVLGSNDTARDPFTGETGAEPDPVEAHAPSSGITAADLLTLGKTIADGVNQGMAANAPRRKVTIGQYDPKTWAQPDRTKTHKLQRECYQNGAWMNPHSMTNAEIDGLNGITHNGRYLDRIVEVFIRSNGSEDEVHIRYNNKTPSQRLEFQKMQTGLRKGETGLEYMLRVINDVQAEERAEYEADADARKQRIQQARFAAMHARG